jgi:hypothetical protein
MSGRHVILANPGVGELQISEVDGPEEQFGLVQINAIRGGFDIGITRLTRFYDALRAHNTTVSASEAEAKRFFESAQRDRNQSGNQ